jgi:hypothetical protein
MGTLRDDQYMFLIISLSFLLGVRNASDKSFRDNENTHFMHSTFFFFFNCTIYEIMWKNIVESGRPEVTIWHMWIVY